MPPLVSEFSPNQSTFVLPPESQIEPHNQPTIEKRLPYKGFFFGDLERQERQAVYEDMKREAVIACNPDRACWAAGNILRLQKLPDSIPDVITVRRAPDDNRIALEALRQAAPSTDPEARTQRLHKMQSLTRQVADQVGRVHVDDTGLTVFAPQGTFRLETPYPLSTAEQVFRPRQYAVDPWFSERVAHWDEMPTEPLPPYEEPTGRFYPSTRHDLTYLPWPPTSAPQP